MKNPQPSSQPFFARFLEVQDLDTATGGSDKQLPPEDHTVTQAYGFDSDDRGPRDPGPELLP